MTDFNDLAEAGASQDADQFAVARGNQTMRQTVARLLAAARAADTLPAATARATSAAHWAEWAVRLGIAQAWADIPANTAIRVGKIALHSGAVYCCITAHAKGVIGPPQDRGNWLRVSDHAGVVSYAANTIIPESSRGWTYRATGHAIRLLSLPDASGADEVENGWDVVVSNGSAADQTVRPNGADTVGGNAALTLAPGRVVKLQKVATGVWILVADTKDESGEAGAPFMPSQANLYEAVKAIFQHNTAVSADDANLELDFASGAAGALADNSIAPIKLLANRAADKKSMRLRIGAVSVVGIANALPAVADHNINDLAIVWRGGATVVPFREIDAPTVELNATVAGDLIQLYPAGWTRVSNLYSGSLAAAAARAIAEANRDRLMCALTQGDFYGGSREAIQGTYHINVESMPGAFADANKVEVWIGDPGISRVLSQAWDPTEIQRNLEFEISASVADNLATNGLVDIGDELGVEIRLLAPGNVERYRKGFDFPVIVKPDAVPTRFRRPVGASGSAGNVPAGTENFTGYLTKGTDTHRYTFGIDLVDIPAAPIDFSLESSNPQRDDPSSPDSVGIRLGYVVGTRTLTYSARGNNVVLRAIRAKGFS